MPTSDKVKRHSLSGTARFRKHGFYHCFGMCSYNGNSLEVKVLESEVGLHNTGSLHPGPQDILLGWDIGRTGYSV